jgi:hypothetical protein
VTNPSRLPTRGPGRIAALAALEAVVAADTVQTLDEMTRAGWTVEAALDSYRAWWVTLINAAIDEGVAEWIWRVPS